MNEHDKYDEHDYNCIILNATNNEFIKKFDYINNYFNLVKFIIDIIKFDNYVINKLIVLDNYINKTFTLDNYYNYIMANNSNYFYCYCKPEYGNQYSIIDIEWNEKNVLSEDQAKEYYMKIYSSYDRYYNKYYNNLTVLKIPYSCIIYTFEKYITKHFYKKNGKDVDRLKLEKKIINVNTKIQKVLNVEEIIINVNTKIQKVLNVEEIKKETKEETRMKVEFKPKKYSKRCIIS
jgi:hypothetical protein